MIGIGNLLKMRWLECTWHKGSVDVIPRFGDRAGLAEVRYFVLEKRVAVVVA
ncbi:hypothetical protein D3C72_2582770 [compost metagenome]